MMKKMKLGHRISIGFGVTLFILVLMSCLSWFSLRKINHYLQNAETATLLMENALLGQLDFEEFTIDKTMGHLEKSYQNTKEMQIQAEELLSHITVDEQIEDVEIILAQREIWQNGFKEYFDEEQKINDAEAEMVRNAKVAVVDIADAVDTLKHELLQELAKNDEFAQVKATIEVFEGYRDIETFLLNIRVQVLRYMRHGKPEDKDAVSTLFENVYSLADSIKSKQKHSSNRSNLDSIITYLKGYQSSFLQYADYIEKQHHMRMKMEAYSDSIIEVSEELEQEEKHAVNSVMTRTTIVLLTLAVSGISIGVLFSIFITLGITKPINMVIQGLSGGSLQVSSASAQVSSSSQSLAEGASEQAASLEEISSSLEEITSMTKQSAENAASANDLMQDTKEKSRNGKSAMEQLSVAMSDIQASSDQTSAVIKSIEEIAFQTNLLALNAAVEAARAGEAGKGFAVVAEEVRNLAQRASEAAKDTNELIEKSRQNADRGVLLTTDTFDIICSIVESSEKVAVLVSEISSAASNQSDGIVQVNQAVNQMSEITQSNASGAEEFASASVELSSQSNSLREIIGDLVKVVHGANGTLDGHASQFSINNENADCLIAQKSKAPGSEKLIPFNDEYSGY